MNTKGIPVSTDLRSPLQRILSSNVGRDISTEFLAASVSTQAISDLQAEKDPTDGKWYVVSEEMKTRMLPTPFNSEREAWNAIRKIRILD